MDAVYKPVPLRCVLMTISVGVLLILLCAGPACTHKNRGSKPHVSVTILPSLEIPVLKTPQEDASALEDSTQEVPRLPRRPWPPQESWQLFVKHSDRGANSKRKSQEDTQPRFHHPGPIGPPAPPSHHGHPLNTYSQGKRQHCILQLLRELLTKRQNGKHYSEHGHPLALLPPTVHAAFICRTNGNTNLEPEDERELQLYQMPQEDGSFYRGAGLNLTSGRYTAPFAGLYTFTARLIIDLGKRAKVENPEGFLRVQLCIQSLCQQHLSLQALSSFIGNEVPHTVTLSGVLYLQAGQYVSIFLENWMGFRLVVKRGSDFSGVLLGR
ncbi:erythroferrone isoform X2 [Ascaphus truei]|uniref:erythroferrone isoform X2 n=1 Tax=Ascaphus truei TaxID=8439 RepID=UPI003F594CBA